MKRLGKKSFKQRAMEKHAPKKTAAEVGPTSIPDIVQLPGGKALEAFSFRITKVSETGRPLAFEVCDQKDRDCALFATSSFMHGRLPDVALERVKKHDVVHTTTQLTVEYGKEYDGTDYG